MNILAITETAAESMGISVEVFEQPGAIARSIQNEVEKNSPAYHLASAAQYLAQNQAESLRCEAEQVLSYLQNGTEGKGAAVTEVQA